MKCLENNFLCIRVRAACGTAWMRGEQRSYLDLWWRLRWHLRQTNVFSWILIDTNYDVGACEVVILMTFIGQLHGPTFESRIPPQAASRCHVCLRRRYLWADDTLSEILGDTVTSAQPSTVELQTKIHEWRLSLMTFYVCIPILSLLTVGSHLA